MEMDDSPIAGQNEVRQAAAKQILLLPHALNRMIAPDIMITADEVRGVVFHGEIIEDYPEDARGRSCLVLGFGNGERPIHVVCSPKPEYLAVITVYLPDPGKWQDNWRNRREV